MQVEEIGNGRRGIRVPVTFEVPVVWSDARYVRERLGGLTETAEAMLRVVDPSEVRAPRTPRGGNQRADDPSVFGHTLDGRAWRRLPSEGADGPARLAAFLATLGGPRASKALQLDLPQRLTTKAGQPQALGDESPLAGKIIKAFRDEAEAQAARHLAEHVAYDGESILVSKDWEHGLQGPPRSATVFDTAIRMLEIAAQVPAADLDVARLAAPIRLAVARDRVGAVTEADLPAVRDAVAALAEGLPEELRRRRSNRGWGGGLIAMEHGQVAEAVALAPGL